MRLKSGQEVPPCFLDEVGSFQAEFESPAARHDIYKAMHVSEDVEMVKNLLFELSTSQMSYKTKGTNSIHRHTFQEAIMHYDNSHGDVGISFLRSKRRTNQAQIRTHFPGLFRGLKKFFKNQVMFMLCCNSKFGLAITYEYYGAIPSIPDPSPNSQHSKLFLSLQSIVRYELVKSRARSPLHNIARYGLRLNVASFTHEYFLPSFLSLAYGARPITHAFSLHKKYTEIASQRAWRTFAEYQQGLKFRFVNHFQSARRNTDSATNMQEADIQIANHFSYQFYDYLDHFFRSRDKSDLMICSRTSYQDPEINDEEKRWEKDPVS